MESGVHGIRGRTVASPVMAVSRNVSAPVDSPSLAEAPVQGTRSKAGSAILTHVKVFQSTNVIIIVEVIIMVILIIITVH